MNQLTAPARFKTPTETARREYDDGNPGTIMTGQTASQTGPAAPQRRAGEWAERRAATYYDDGEAATILV